MFSFVTRTEFAPQPPRIHQQFAVMMQRLDRTVANASEGTIASIAEMMEMSVTDPKRDEKLFAEGLEGLVASLRD